MAKLIDSSKIARTGLYKERPVLQRLYILPFIVLYSGWLYGWLRVRSLDRVPGWLVHPEFFLIPLLLIACAHFVLFMSRFWSVQAEALVCYQRARSIDEAQYMLVVPTEHNGKAALCMLQREKGHPIEFMFQQRKFIYDDNKRIFKKLAYPDSDTVGQYIDREGVTGAEAVSSSEYYGLNEFKIPVPTFTELWKEHAVAPFFVFQVFCVGLWLLDDYWYYSLFTLVMLCVFESTVVYQRLRNIRDFQTMSVPVVNVSVRRDQKWTEVTSDKLLPGDLVTFKLEDKELTVPCDIILLHGSLVVNEAMLSGESTPLLKESVEDEDRQAMVDIKLKHRNHVLFGGTKVMIINKPQAKPKNLDLRTAHHIVY